MSRLPMTMRHCLLLLMMLPVAACGMGELSGVKGSGVATTVTRDVPAFTGVEVACHCVLHLNGQATQRVSISGDDNIVPLLTTEVREGTLYVRAEQPYRQEVVLTVDIDLPELRRLAFSGAGKIELRAIQTDKFELSVSGAGSVAAAGHVRELDMRLSGAGSIAAKELEAAIVRATLSGAGNIETSASEQIDATASGVGAITYYGDPKQVNTRMSGIGKITKG